MQNLKSNQIIYVYWQRQRAGEYFDCEENNVTNVKKEWGKSGEKKKIAIQQR